MAHYVLRPDAADTNDDPPYPDLAALKGLTQRMRDDVSALIATGDGADAIHNAKCWKTLQEIEDDAVALANQIAAVRLPWTDLR